MSHVDVEHAKACLDQLLDRVARGEEVVITKSDRPVARLSAVTGERRRTFGSIEGEIWMSEDFDDPLDDFQEYM
jgi:antitoxin (DNA-binding transcriptional repressor) of toxin-antitoxin stability system